MSLGRLVPTAVASHLPVGLRSLGWGGVAMARYGDGSTLRYSELIVFAAVWHRFTPAAFITHIYVDHEVSLRGGHEIWGLPKVLADFDWRPRGLVMSVGREVWLTARFVPPRRGVPLPVVVPALGRPQGRLAGFLALGSMRVAPRRVGIEVSPAAPFAGLGLERPRLTLAGPRLDLRVHGPA